MGPWSSPISSTSRRTSGYWACFTASPFDFGGLGFNVTHYSNGWTWRLQRAPTSWNGNWEQIGTVPAQGFSQYGYTAATLVDAAPGDWTCPSSFIAIAHTTDDNIYRVSDGRGLQLRQPRAQHPIGWRRPARRDRRGHRGGLASSEEVDYAYTAIERADGVSVNVVGDTLRDADAMPTSTTASATTSRNGNPSDTAYVSVTVVSDATCAGAGVEPHLPHRTPVDASVAAVMASLLPGNLETPFLDQGVTLDPAGLPSSTRWRQSKTATATGSRWPRPPR